MNTRATKLIRDLDLAEHPEGGFFREVLRTLVGCSVGPGFDFADFKLLKDDRDMAGGFREALPEVAGLI